MLEWYRAQADYTRLMDDTVELVRACARACGVKVLKENGRECDPFAPWEKYRWRRRAANMRGLTWKNAAGGTDAGT